MIKVSPANEGVAAGVRGWVADIIIGVGERADYSIAIYVYMEHSTA